MRTVVITGATSGFGKGLVGAFLRNGDRVIATGRKLTSRDLLTDERALAMGRLIEKDLDITSPQERAEFSRFCRQELKQVDILVNNAGMGVFGALEDATEEQIRQQMDVNYFGLVHVTQDLLPLLRLSRGKIFNFSSVLGFMGMPLTSLYCASKFAVEGLSEALAFEVRPYGVQVCIIEPGKFPTEFGANLAWSAKSSEPGSAYRKQTENYESVRSGLSKPTIFNRTEYLINGVVKLSNRKCVPLRKRFGLDCQGTHYLRRLLPECVFIAIAHFMFKLTLNRGA